jgi:hypothetical protein
MRLNYRFALHPAVVAGMSIAIFLLLVPFAFSGMLVYQTGMYPNAHVAQSNGLKADTLCRTKNCVWSVTFSTRTVMETGDSLVLVSNWQHSHTLRGINRFGPFDIVYRLGDYDSLMCMCPHAYVTFSSLAVAYDP